MRKTIYYDKKRQVLWCNSWVVPIEEVGVERINNYQNKIME